MPGVRYGPRSSFGRWSLPGRPSGTPRRTPALREAGPISINRIDRRTRYTPAAFFKDSPWPFVSHTNSFFPSRPSRTLIRVATDFALLTIGSVLLVYAFRTFMLPYGIAGGGVGGMACGE